MPMSVYIAEDDSEDYLILEEALIELLPGISLRWSRNGEDLINQLSIKDNMLPHLIILDNDMPKLNGMETLLRLNQIVQFQPVPKVIYSSGSSQVYKEKALLAGALGYFQKGNSYPQVLSDVKQMLSFGSKILSPSVHH